MRKLLCSLALAMVATGANYQGYLDVANCGTVSGWAYDIASPNATVAVEIFDAGVSVARIAANGFRQDLKDARPPIGNGNHAFTWEPKFADGKLHVIYARVETTMLYNSPRAAFFCSLPVGPCACKDGAVGATGPVGPPGPSGPTGHDGTGTGVPLKLDGWEFASGAVPVPTSSTSACKMGQWGSDDSKVCLCTGTNKWKCWAVLQFPP